MGFNISDAASRLNQSAAFFCKQFEKNEDEESWVFMKPLTLLGKECLVEIDVTLRLKENLLIFLMPMYGDGSEGLMGENLNTFDALVHQFNSRTKGGYFTKYTYDNSYAPVFMHHLPLSRMDFDWFKSTLDYFVTILIAFRPLFDPAITNLGLKFDKNAGLADSARKYLLRSANPYLLLGGDKVDAKQ